VFEEYYTKKQLQEAWKVSERKVERLIAEGKLASTLIGRSRRIPASAVEEYLAKQTAASK
jgi:excisionase family DNA binding protein